MRPALSFAGDGQGAADPAPGPVKVGLLHSLSGTMALSEVALLEAERMAIDEVNRGGGVLGRLVEPVVADGASTPEGFAAAARELLGAGVCALFGCWTSAARKEVRRVVEAADSLLWYPVQYEGLEQSPWVCYTGSCLNQQIVPGVEWMLRRFGPRIFLLGSDYVFPRTAHQLIRSLVGSQGGEIVGEEYVELGGQDFGVVLERVRRARPDALMNTLNGDSNLAFYRQAHAAGVRAAQLPIMATSATETELGPVAEVAAGHLACSSYFQSLDTPENRAFVEGFRARQGGDRVVSAPAVTAYVQVFLWKQAVERAGEVTAGAVRRCLAGCAMESPMGRVRIEANQHLSMPVRIGRLRADGQFDLLWQGGGMVTPLPWLGVEELEFSGKEMVIKSLAAFADGIDQAWRLAREMAESRALEAALAQSNVELEAVVRDRTRQLEDELVERRQREEALRQSRTAALDLMKDAEETITSFSHDRGELAGFMAVQREIGARKQAERRSAAFADLGNRLNAARTAREAAEIFVETADALLGWDCCTLYLYAAERDRVRPLLHVDLFDGQRRECTEPPGEYPVWPFCRRVLEEGAQLTLRREPLVMPAGSVPFGNTARPSASLMHVPVREGKRIIGLLSIQSYRFNAYTEADLATLQSLADHCAGTLRRIDEEESRRRAEAALRESEARFRTLIEHSSDLITVIDAEGVIRFQSPSSERLLGYTPAELTGRRAFEWIHAEDAPAVVAVLQRAQTHRGAPTVVEYRFRHRDGTWRTLESIGRSIAGADGDPFIAVNSRDVTEHRKLEEQLRQSQKMDAIGRLAGGVAHDFNNILAAIMMQTGLMQGEPGLSVAVRDGLRQLHADAERAANLTRQLLLFSRKQVLQSRDLDVNETVGCLVKMLQRIIGEDVRLELHLHPTPLVIRADGGLLDQVLMNLAVNARDAMPQGGTLRIETAEEAVDDARARLHPDAAPGRFAVVAVSDTGCGIAPEVLPRIFEPFFTTKGPGQGTGLGLATVFGIVRQHRGWIEVQSEPGRGTRFQIFLPALDAVSAPGVRDEARPAPRGGTETLLLVEDDAAVRKVAMATLQRHGYRVVEASSGAEALRVWPAVRDQVALLLTDLVMPEGVNGHELARRLRAERAGLKVIYMSGYSADMAGQELALSRGEHFLQKPFPIDTLLEIVRRCLDG